MGTALPKTTRVPGPLLAKVPEITLLFWVAKILTTGMGEAASDYLGSINLVLAGAVGVAGFVLAMWLQLRTSRYIAPVYWFAVAMVALFGTMAADGLHVALGIPYIATSIFYALAVAIIFIVWRRSEGTLSIHSITSRRREMFYWAAVLATFALGTAVGDLTAISLHLGFFASGVLFAALFAVPTLGWWLFGLNPIVAFWSAYVITRPLGASFADWFGKPHSTAGGLGFGDGTVTLVATAAIVIIVGYLAVRRSDIQPASAELPVVQGDPAVTNG